MLPQSVVSAVLMYFRSGQITRYAPMLTSCFTPSLNPSSTAFPPITIFDPDTQISASLAVSPAGLAISSPIPRGVRLASIG
mgnify:CR=1 FL=1